MADGVDAAAPCLDCPLCNIPTGMYFPNHHGQLGKNLRKSGGFGNSPPVWSSPTRRGHSLTGTRPHAQGKRRETVQLEDGIP